MTAAPKTRQQRRAATRVGTKITRSVLNSDVGKNEALRQAVAEMERRQGNVTLSRRHRRAMQSQHKQEAT
ncbi:hypothetical protein [Shimia sp.]|uniref:hypothetical protein n=1 Tax=Shimia sp. TaxID=1954381 RepID=UPI003298EFBD